MYLQTRHYSSFVDVVVADHADGILYDIDFCLAELCKFLLQQFYQTWFMLLHVVMLMTSKSDGVVIGCRVCAEPVLGNGH
jgi:hypothetical protein